MADQQIVASRLTELESVIDGGMKTFVEVGTALAAIRDERLYKTTHSDFDEYCRERWGFSRRRAGQMIEAATVAEKVGNIFPTFGPQNSQQAAALASIPDEHRSEIWKTVVAEHGDSVTARDIRETAHVLDAARAEPDGATLVEQVTSGNWDIPEVKKELRQRGVDWKQPTNVTAMPSWVDKLPEETVDKLADSLYRIQLPDMVSQVVLRAQEHITKGSRRAQKELQRIDWNDVTDEMRSDKAITDAIYFVDAELGRFAEVIGRARLTQPGIRSVK